MHFGSASSFGAVHFPAAGLPESARRAWRTEMAEDFLLVDVLSDARREMNDSRSFKLLCPVCQSNYLHTRQAERIRADKPYGAKWGGKGDLLIIPIEGECSHVWEICFGFHKGETLCFARTTDRHVDEAERQPE